MKWILSFHIIFVITWFSGLFYLPRLFVYHSMSDDQTSIERFKVMEHKLYYYITLPSAILASGFGFWLLQLKYDVYRHQNWMHAKLILVALLWVYQFICMKYLNALKHDRNRYSHVFYRWFNEIPSVILVAVVILAIVQP